MKKKMLMILAAGFCLVSQAVSVYGADYEYDDLGRVTKVVYEDGSSVTYSYDANGNIVEIFTGTEWDDEESGENGGVSGEGSQTGESGAKGSGAGNGGGSGRLEGENVEGNQSGIQDELRNEDSGESVEGEEGIEEKGLQEETDEQGNKGNRYENVIAAVLAAIGIAVLILIRRLKDRSGDKDKLDDGKASEGNQMDEGGKDREINAGKGDGETE